MLKLYLEHDGSKGNTELASNIKEMIQSHFDDISTKEIISFDAIALKITDESGKYQLGTFDSMPDKESLRLFLTFL